MKAENPIIKLQEELENSNSTNKLQQYLFYEITKNLMNHFVLKIDTLEIEFTEVEFYYFECQYHTDLYVHLDLLQKESSEYLYVHKKPKGRGGIDLTFGNGKFFGGILIRGIKDGDIFIFGPAKVREHISKKMGIQECDHCDHNVLQDKFEDLKNKNGISLQKRDQSKEQYDILHSTRIGLDPKVHKEYSNALYRFVRLDSLEAKKDKLFDTYDNLRERTKPKAISYLTGVCKNFSNEKSMMEEVKNNKQLIKNIEEYEQKVSESFFQR